MSNDAIDDLNEQEQIRREKLARIQSKALTHFLLALNQITLF